MKALSGMVSYDSGADDDGHIDVLQENKWVSCIDMSSDHQRKVAWKVVLSNDDNR